MTRQLTSPNPENATLAEIDEAIKVAPPTGGRDRLRAIRGLLLGLERTAIFAIFAISERTLRRWIKAYNEQGVDGLIDRLHPGRPRVIAEEQASEFEEVFDEPSAHGRDHWTARAFHGWLRESAEVEIGYSTVCSWLRDRGFRLKVPQPWPDRQDPAKRAAYLEELAVMLKDEDVELWYTDESGFEGEARPRRRWGKRGERLRLTKNGEHLRMNVVGMVNPRTGKVFLLEFTHCDAEVFQVFLDEAQAEGMLTERKRQVLIMDNASWHKSKKINWGRFEPMYLPPYSPDFNPIERLWLLIKQEWFKAFSTSDRDKLIERLDKALCWAIDRGEANSKTCAIRS